MPKTLGLTIVSDTGKKCHGVAADNYIIYNKCHGLPAYTLMVIGATLFSAGAIYVGYDKLKQYHLKKISSKNNSESSDGKPVD